MTSITPSPEAWNKFIGGLAQLVGPDFVEASDHVGSCCCDICLQWWVKIGPDDNGKYGPFTKAEIMAALVKDTGDEAPQEIDEDA